MNKVILIGRITKDPELRNTPTGVPVVSFTIAVNRTYQDKNGERQADFINCIAWRNQAENLARYIRKGGLIPVDGSIQTRSYDDQNGNKRYVTEVVADNVQFLDTKASREQRMNSNNDVNPYNLGEQTSENTSTSSTNDIPEDPFKDFGEEIKVEENDLPF